MVARAPIITRIPHRSRAVALNSQPLGNGARQRLLFSTQAGYQYISCSTTSYTGNSLQAGQSPAVAVGYVFAASLLSSPSNYAITVYSDGTWTMARGGDSSRQSFQYDIYNSDLGTWYSTGTSNSSPKTIWENNIPPAWISTPSIAGVINQNIVPVVLTNNCTDAEGDALTFTVVSGALP